jgi:hypothetical protein
VGGKMVYKKPSNHLPTHQGQQQKLALIPKSDSTKKAFLIFFFIIFPPSVNKNSLVCQ